MTNERVIELLKADLEHSKHHLNYTGKADEFYAELKEWCEALEIVIKIMEEHTK